MTAPTTHDEPIVVEPVTLGGCDWCEAGTGLHRVDGEMRCDGCDPMVQCDECQLETRHHETSEYVESCACCHSYERKTICNDCRNVAMCDDCMEEE